MRHHFAHRTGLVRTTTGRAALALACAASAALPLGGCASNRASARAPGIAGAGPVAVEGGPDAELAKFYTAGPVTFGPQPDAAQLAAFRARGGTTVINLRSSGEMTRLSEEGFDEPAAVRDAGLLYAHIPLGGEEGYDPAAVDAFARVVEAAPGPVLIHCASGGRARTMWQAYLVTQRSLSPQRAAEIAATIGQEPAPLEQLLGRRLEVRAGEPLPAKE